MSISHSYLVQSNYANPSPNRQNNIAIGPDGTLYTTYTIGTDLRVAHSVDAGQTWIEVSASTTGEYSACAIDSGGTLHVMYNTGSGTDLLYRQYTVGGGWSGATTAGSGVSSGTTGTCVAVDSVDDVHTAFSTAARAIKYIKRTSGTWGSVTTLMAADHYEGTSMTIDSNNNILVLAYNNLSSNSNAIHYAKYVSSWTSNTLLYQFIANGANYPYQVVDSSNNVYVVFNEPTGSGSLATGTYVIMYTQGTDTWGSPNKINTSTDIVNPSISRDTNDNLWVLGNSGNDLWGLTYNGSTWSAETKLLTAAANRAYSDPILITPIDPVLSGVNISVPSAGFYFVFNDNDTIGGTNNLRYAPSDDLTQQVPQTKNYSREAAGSLPSNSANLSTLFNQTGYNNVSLQDNIFEDQTATNQYAIFEFKNQNANNTDPINVVWIGKTSIAASTSTVVLQIYNNNTPAWETLSSNTTAAAGAEFTLTGTQSSNLSHYYDVNDFVSCRVYQLAQ